MNNWSWKANGTWNGVGRKVKDKTQLNATRAHGFCSATYLAGFFHHDVVTMPVTNAKDIRGYTVASTGQGELLNCSVQVIPGDRQRSSWVRPPVWGRRPTPCWCSQPCRELVPTNQSRMTTWFLKGRRVRLLSGHCLTELQPFKSLCPRSPVSVGLMLTWMVLWEATMALLYHPGA